MNYNHIVPAIFLSRPNRFIAHALVEGKEVVCHVKNTGRLRELLYPGAALLLEYHPDAEQLGRKTAYSLIGVYKEPGGCSKKRILINIDSQAPNQVAEEWLKSGAFSSKISHIKREVTYRDSRFDLAFTDSGRPAFMEVKGVTLETDGVACFPDAPTLRGVKHVTELIHAVTDGYSAYLLFVIQMQDISYFTPNRMTHAAFADALKLADASGVHILAYNCLITEDSMKIYQAVDVNL
ncbi:MAG: DNA/RNA nuclease SfsA [Clostridium sp.]